MSPRKLCKIAVALKWGIGQLRDCQPTSGADMREQAEKVRAKLELKGCSVKEKTLPGFLHNVQGLSTPRFKEPWALRDHKLDTTGHT